MCNLLVEETSVHLFLDCPFAKNCWNSLGFNFQNNLSLPDAVTQIRLQGNPRFFMISAILMSWAIWTIRNGFIFNNIQPQVELAKEVFLKELKLLTLRVKARDSLIFDLWIQNLL